MAKNKNSFQHYFEKIPKPFRNKYIITLLVFCAIMLFFDKRNVFSQMKLQSTINELKSKNEFYKTENIGQKAGLGDPFTNEETLEEFAREEYYMKRTNEDIFVIEELEK